LFFGTKLVLLFLSALSREGGKGSRYMKNLGPVNTVRLLVKARFWIVGHFVEILENRKERQLRGLVDPRVHRAFNWNIFRTL